MSVTSVRAEALYDWQITLRPASVISNQIGATYPKPIDVTAAYWIDDEGWLHFKNRNHKIVFSVAANAVLSITRGRALADD